MMEITGYRCRYDLHGPDSGRVTFTATLDLHHPLTPSLVNVTVKPVLGVLTHLNQVRCLPGSGIEVVVGLHHPLPPLSLVNVTVKPVLGVLINQVRCLRRGGGHPEVFFRGSGEEKRVHTRLFCVRGRSVD